MHHSPQSTDVETGIAIYSDGQFSASMPLTVLILSKKVIFATKQSR